MLYYNKYLKYKKKYKLTKIIGGSINNNDCYLNFYNTNYSIHHFSNLPKLPNDTRYNENNNKIYYNHYLITNFNSNFVFNILNILNECKQKNILIYIENENEPSKPNTIDIQYNNFINAFNNFINNNKIKYYNVTIINKLFNENYSLIWSNKFKKIMNVIYTSHIFNILDTINGSVCSQISQIPQICSVDKSNKISYIKKSYIITHNTNKYQYIITTNSNWNDNNLIIQNRWWYLYYFNVPICAYGRLLQSSGTCWCNALLNSVLLNTSISILLLQKININKTYIETKLENAISLINNKKLDINKIINNNLLLDIDTIIDSKLPLDIIVLYIFKEILVNNNKATNLNGNIVQYVAWKLKQEYTIKIIKKKINQYKLNIENCNSNIKIDESNIEKCNSNIKISEFNIEKVYKPNIEIFESNIKIGESNIEIFESNIEIFESNIEKVYKPNIEIFEFNIKIGESNIEIFESNIEKVYKPNIEIFESNIEKMYTFKNKLQETKTKLQETKTKLQETKTKLQEANKELKEEKTKLQEEKIKLQEANKELKEEKTKLQEANKELKEVSDQFNNIVTGDDGDSNLGIPIILLLLFDNILFLVKNIDDNTYTYNDNLIDINTLEIDYEIIVITYNYNKNYTYNTYDIQKEFIINTTIYNCTSSVLSLTNANHNIAGLNCNGKYYVYDSNNYITYTDWTNNNNNEYRTLLKTHYVNYPGYDLDDLSIQPYYIKYVIYTKIQ